MSTVAADCTVVQVNRTSVMLALTDHCGYPARAQRLIDRGMQCQALLGCSVTSNNPTIDPTTSLCPKVMRSLKGNCLTACAVTEYCKDRLSGCAFSRTFAAPEAGQLLL